MKKLLLAAIVGTLVFGWSAPINAAQGKQKKPLNLDPENIRRASEVMKRNQKLFSDKVLFERYQKMVRDINTNT